MPAAFLLAVVFIFSGFVKAVDPLGTQYKIQDYLEAFGWAASVLAFLPFLASILQAMVEFCLGVYPFVWYPQKNDNLVCCAYHGGDDSAHFMVGSFQSDIGLWMFWRCCDFD